MGAKGFTRILQRLKDWLVRRLDRPGLFSLECRGAVGWPYRLLKMWGIDMVNSHNLFVPGKGRFKTRDHRFKARRERFKASWRGGLFHIAVHTWENFQRKWQRRILLSHLKANWMSTWIEIFWGDMGAGVGKWGITWLGNLLGLDNLGRRVVFMQYSDMTLQFVAPWVSSECFSSLPHFKAVWVDRLLGYNKLLLFMWVVE